MPYIIPAVAVAIGVWGAKKIFTQDDSADKKAMEIMRKIPEKIRDHVEVKSNKDGSITIQPKLGAPKEIEIELQKNIEIVKSNSS